MVWLITSLFGFYGIVENDTTWSDTAYLTGDVWVERGVTLTIEPGTVVLYADSCEWDTVWETHSLSYPQQISEAGQIDLIVEGSMKAHGGREDSIRFVCLEAEESGRGTVILSNGCDSLDYCAVLESDDVRYDSPRLFVEVAEVVISNSRFHKGAGVWGYNSSLSIKGCFFDTVSLHPVDLRGGSLLVENSEFVQTGSLGNYYECKGVITGRALDSFQVRDVKVDIAVGAWEKLCGGGAAACFCDSCYFVEVLNSSLERIVGGFGAPSMGCGGCGGMAYGVYLRNCEAVTIQGNSINAICGGAGEDNIEDPGRGGDGVGIYVKNCVDVSIDKNRISNIHGGEAQWHPDDEYDGVPMPLICYNSTPMITNNEFNSDGIYIYIDSTSQPVIGGAPGKGNHFLKAADRDYLVYNDSPYDINATWNFWECSPSLIDSLVFDHYDDPTKGIVHYDNSTDVEEEQGFSPQPICLSCNLVDDVIHLSLSSAWGGSAELNLVDVAGRRVLSETVRKSQAVIDVSSLPQGVYFLSAATERSGYLIRKVIIY